MGGGVQTQGGENGSEGFSHFTFSEGDIGLALGNGKEGSIWGEGKGIDHILKGSNRAERRRGEDWNLDSGKL